MAPIRRNTKKCSQLTFQLAKIGMVFIIGIMFRMLMKWKDSPQRLKAIPVIYQAREFPISKVEAPKEIIQIDRKNANIQAKPAFHHYLELPVFNSSKCPKSVVRDGSCVHANNKMHCVPPLNSCQRPCGAFALKLRGAGGVVLREGLLMSIFGGAAFGKGLDEAFLVSEGWALGSPAIVDKALKFHERNGIFLTALRHPINRIYSRYW